MAEKKKKSNAAGEPVERINREVGYHFRKGKIPPAAIRGAS